MPASSGVLVTRVTACTIFISSAMRPYTDRWRFSDIIPSNDLLTMLIVNFDSSPPESSTISSCSGSNACSLQTSGGG